MAESTAAPPSETGGRGNALVVLVVLLSLAGYWWSQRVEPLTIIVVSLDTTRPDHLSPYGSERDTSPTLARLAREGTVFTQARTTAPWTLPSHMSLFTGLPPELHGVRYDWHVLSSDRRTMGEIFSDAGFRTAGLFTGPYVHGSFGFDRGMDTYASMTRQPMLQDRMPTSMTKEQKQSIVLQAELQSHREVTGPSVVARMPFFLEDFPRERNLFFLHLFDPHYDYRAPAKFEKGLLDPDYRGDIDGEAVMAQPWALLPSIPEDDLAQLKGLYDAELRFTDAQLGKLMKSIEASDQAENTVLVVVADHGESFFESGELGQRFGHRFDLSDSTLRVPMIFWGPGRVPAGQTIEEAVSLTDVLPTLLDIAELPEEPDLYGRSLAPLMRGEAVEPGEVAALLDFVPPQAERSYTRHVALVLDGLKYVRVEDLPWSPVNRGFDQSPSLAGTRREYLFDLGADPDEERNMITSSPDDPRVGFMRKAYARRVESLREFAEDRGWEEARVSGDAELAELTALGYTGGSFDEEAPMAPDPEQD